MILRLLWVLLALAAPAAAQAQWREATTRHFIVYGDEGEEKLREAALDLERYDHLLRLALGVPDDHPARLKVYLLKDYTVVQKTLGYGRGGGVLGYYSSSPRGSIAVGTRLSTWAVAELNSENVLLHEYAHHLMLQHFVGYFPRWFTEGFAEYYGMARILPNNVIEVGRPASHRKQIFEYPDWLPLKTLLTARTYADVNYRVGHLYAEGWLLVHYLNNAPERAGQLGRYLAAINSGVDLKTAMNQAFGEDARELDKELRGYARKRKFDALRITFDALDVGEARVRLLGGSEAGMLEHDIALGRGIFARHAQRFAKDVRSAAAHYPGEAFAAGLLTEAEYHAGNNDAAVAAADAWLALKPGEPRALAFKARARAAQLTAAGSKEKKDWAELQAWLQQAKTAAPKDPLVLEAFYDGFAAQGLLPPARAQNALFQAMELVPQEDRLRQKVAADFEARNLIEAAIDAIAPSAFGSHDPEGESEAKRKKRERAQEKWREAGEAKTETAREMLARLEAKLAATKGGAPAATQALAKAAN
jgi:hypothetical protein